MVDDSVCLTRGWISVKMNLVHGLSSAHIFVCNT